MVQRRLLRRYYAERLGLYPMLDVQRALEEAYIAGRFDEQTDRADVRRDAHARRPASHRAVHDHGGGEGAEGAAERAGDDLLRVVDDEPEGPAEDSARDEREPGADAVHAQDPGEQEPKPEPDSDRDADRVPVAH